MAALAASQGQYDSFCGYYAVVNSIYKAYPSIEKPGREQLFKLIMKELPSDFVKESLLDGLTSNGLLTVLQASATTLMRAKLKLVVYHIAVPQRKDSIYNAINKAFTEFPDSAIIIGILYDVGGHWTSIVDATPSTLYCYDGVLSKNLKKAHYGSSWCRKVGSDLMFQIVVEQVID